jgi:hypothetical protein
MRSRRAGGPFGTGRRARTGRGHLTMPLAEDIVMVVLGVVILAAWVWLLRRIGRTTEAALAEGRPMPKWSTNSFYANIAVFGMMLMLCAGIILIAYGFGLGASFK